MVSYSVPMSYQSLRTVLLHTDPNMRFKIAHRIPRIRLTEKNVPVRIKFLDLAEFKTTVNGQAYELGVYRHYYTEDIPMGIMMKNSEGGVGSDLDQYGFEISKFSTPILNGDVSFRSGFVARRTDTEEIEQGYQDSLRRFEDALAKVNQLESEGKTVEEFLAGPLTEDDQRIRFDVGLSKDDIQTWVYKYRAYLLPFHYRRNNISPPYTCFIQLTMAQGKIKTIQRYAYNYKLYEAAKKLNEILFANRPVIIVNKFDHSCYDVLRMPIRFKIYAKFVYTNDSTIIPISSFLDSSRALVDLKIIANYSFENFQHSFVKNAKLLTIITHERMIDQLVRDFGTIENQRIYIVFFHFVNPSAIVYCQLMRGWLSTERNVGSELMFGLKADQTGEEILELLRAGNERTESSERCVTVPLRNATKLEVTYVPLSVEINSSRFLLKAKILKG
ncbi:unnamed protein product [Caenorhabditis nigoni]